MSKDNNKIGTLLTLLIIAIIIYFFIAKPDFFPFSKKTEDSSKIENAQQQIPEDEIGTYGDQSLHKIYTVAEEMPIFKSCEHLEAKEAENCTNKAIQQFIAQVDYPQTAIDNDVQGKVYVRFLIDQTGNVTEISIAKGVDALIDNVALEHIKKMPTFAKPGFQDGKPVIVQYIVPINFRIDL